MHERCSYLPAPFVRSGLSKLSNMVWPYESSISSHLSGILSYGDYLFLITALISECKNIFWNGIEIAGVKIS